MTWHKILVMSKAEKSSAVIGSKQLGKRTGAGGEQSINTKELSGASIQVVDSRDDLDDPDDNQLPLSRAIIAEIEKTEKTDSIAASDDEVSTDARKVNELRQAILELRVYTCKLKGTNRHLQRQNESVKEENTSLIHTVRRLEQDGSDLQEENEQLRSELELLKKSKLDTTMSTLSSHGDDVVPGEDKSLETDLVPLSITIEPDMEYMPKSDLANDAQDIEETTKLTNKSCVTPTSDVGGLADDVQDEEETPKTTNRRRVTPTSDSPLMKLKDTLYDIDELKITVTNDEEEEEDDNISLLRMELGKSREQCEELQTDLKKIAQDYWKQREDMKVYQFRIEELKIENKELQRLKWVEAEVDAMWAMVKKMDKENREWEFELGRLRADKEVLKATIVDKSNEIAELQEKLRNAPCPEWVHRRMDDIQNDLHQMKTEQHGLC